jgi:hypothetical protein
LIAQTQAKAASRRDLQITTAVIIVILLSLLSAGGFVFEPPKKIRPVGQTISQYDKRFEQLRDVLPKRGVVGYLGSGWENRYQVPDYYATQYALAPLVVENSLEPDLVVGNFPEPLDPVATAWPSNLVPIQDFGNGVVLFAKRHE